jgi:hypothetical protein
MLKPQSSCYKTLYTLSLPCNQFFDGAINCISFREAYIYLFIFAWNKDIISVNFWSIYCDFKVQNGYLIRISNVFIFIL